MKYKASLMALLTFILIPNVLFAGIYKCVDGNGNTSFSVEPKPGCTLLQESADADRLALLIGNSDYGDGSSLPNPVNDVRAMKRALERLGFRVLKHENCTQREMKMAMDDFGSRLKGQDVGLFFYAGHGVQVSRYNYLVPVDAKLTSEKKVEYNCVRADRVLAEMEGAGSRTNIIILDACRDNPFTRSWRRGTQGAGLAFMNAPSGSLIAYSTAPGKTALDGGGKNSPYTSALLQHIDIPNTTIIEMFQGVRSTVIAQSEGKQIPWESTSLRGNFYFTKEGTDTRVNDELAIFRRERQELKKLRDEIERKQRESQNQRVEVASVPQQSDYSESSSSYNRTEDTDAAAELTDKAGELMNSDKTIFNEDYEVIINILNRAISLAPSYSNAYTLRGASYSYIDQYAKALQDYNMAIQLDPRNSGHYTSRAYLYAVHLNQYSKALQDYNTAILLEPNDSLSYYIRAQFFVVWEKTEKACADLEKSCELGMCGPLKESKEGGHSFLAPRGTVQCP
jgi:hypothetical protein